MARTWRRACEGLSRARRSGGCIVIGRVEASRSPLWCASRSSRGGLLLDASRLIATGSRRSSCFAGLVPLRRSSIFLRQCGIPANGAAS
jgi:hypothetical protein